MKDDESTRLQDGGFDDEAEQKRPDAAAALGSVRR
jgi:hypothetical protein